jgi:putative hydrolase of the HAD superfamily
VTIRAVVFDIGGVLEITPDIGVTEKWEKKLHLQAGELHGRLDNVWKDGSVGLISEEEVHRNIGQILGINEAQMDAFMDDIWRQYLGELNVELADYFRSLRPQVQTAIISNSFVGARRKEQERYQFEEITDLIIYSHEVGISKPDRRIFELTCERLDVRPAEMIFLDDVESFVTSARELGIHAILYRENLQTIADIEALLQELGTDGAKARRRPWKLSN